MRSFELGASHDFPTADSVLAGLDSDQRAAVTAPPGVIVVRAGAGSGKTTVLTRRIAWRVATNSADAAHTLAITFTRQAATEMRSRLAQFHLDARPTIGTFHAIARRLMIQFAQDKSRPIPVIVNNRSSLLSACMGEDARRGGIQDVIASIDWAHARMLTPQEATAEMSKLRMTIPLGEKRFIEVFDAYEKMKKKRGVVDLNDFLTFVVREAQRDPRYVESLRFQFRHISVDEAQDMNPLQYEFLKTLIGARADLFLVGDPNQAIYGFNGANYQLFDELPGISTPTQVVTLPSNYRCTPEIVDFAVQTLSGQGQHTEAYSRRVPGEPVQLQRFATDVDEVAFLVSSVDKLCVAHRAGDIAILCRTNTVAENVRQALMDANISVSSARRGGEYARAVALATDLTNREDLTAWSCDILDSGEYTTDDADYDVAKLVRQFLDDNRVGTVNGRAFSSWLATSADTPRIDGVEVLTFHAAKGREWPIVFLAGCEKGLLPHRSARSVQTRAEEVRLAYVACTRAVNLLTISWTDQRNQRPSGPSPFLPSLTTAVPIIAAPTQEFRERRTTSSTTPTLHHELMNWCEQKGRQHRIDPHALLTPRQLRAIVRSCPSTLEEVELITDPIFARSFGDEILGIIAQSPQM